MCRQLRRQAQLHPTQATNPPRPHPPSRAPAGQLVVPALLVALLSAAILSLRNLLCVGRFGKASKHCSKCGKASTKVDRPSCKACGSSEWNFEGVSKDESNFLATAQVWFWFCLQTLKVLPGVRLGLVLVWPQTQGTYSGIRLAAASTFSRATLI
jgi:hypothetical protein